MKRLAILLGILCTLTAGYAQTGGITKTDRTGARGLVSFTAGGALTDISNTNHVDGYVKQYGDSRLLFPVGHKGKYRPFAAEADGTTGAYFQENPATATLPTGAPFALTSKESTLATVSDKEYWDINGSNPTRLTLSWNAESAISTLTGNTLTKLSIVGWNTATARWEKIASLVDETSLFQNGSTLTTGSITTLQAIVPDTYSIYTLAALQSASLPANYEGTLEVANCEEIKGWVWDKNYPATILTVELLEGETVLATTTAGNYRADLKDRGIGSGNYGFSLQTPLSLKDGASHQIRLRVRSSSYILPGSISSIFCNYQGNFETADCFTASGWIWDKNSPSLPITVELVENGKVYATQSATNPRNDLKNSGIGTGNYGYNFSLPANLRDGSQHTLSVRAVDANFVLSGSPKLLTCASPQFAGSFDAADCNGVRGWVWATNYPERSFIVELMEGTAVLATATAGAFRADLKNAGYGTGNYAFSFPLPLTLKDGKAHTLSMRVRNEAFTFWNAQKIVNCVSSASRMAIPEILATDSENKMIIENFAVYPNPTAGLVETRFKVEENLKCNLLIINLLGQVIWKKEVVGTGKIELRNIDLSLYDNGIYILQLQTGSLTENKRIVLRK